MLRLHLLLEFGTIVTKPQHKYMMYDYMSYIIVITSLNSA